MPYYGSNLISYLVWRTQRDQSRLLLSTSHHLYPVKGSFQAWDPGRSNRDNEGIQTPGQFGQHKNGSEVH